MQDLADAFIHMASKSGRRLDYTPASARTLDTYIDEFLAGDPSDTVANAVIQGMAAYFGEVVVRAGKASWGFDDESGLSVITMLPDHRPVVFPAIRIANRMNMGSDFSLKAFLDACMDGFVEPNEDEETH